MKNNSLRTVMVARELIRYGSVSKEAPWRLIDCERGAFGTRAAPHRKGDEIHKLMDHSYNTFLAGHEMQEEMAKRLARFFNETGLRQISFDGLEGCWASGHGQYARTRYTKIWYDHLSGELKGRVITDASNPGHYFWHIYTRMNWGEPWYAGFRESQTQYRLKNQRYFYRNLMPGMLGWFKMTAETSLEDAEWLLARAAGFEAGFCLVTSPDIVRQNGTGDRVLAAIKEWEAARMAGAFSAEQRRGLRDIKKEFHLEPAGGKVWDFFPVQSVKSAYKKQDSTLELQNPHKGQPLQFIFQAAGDTRASDLSLEIDDSGEVTIPISLEAGNILKYVGGKNAVLHDSRFNVIKSVDIDPAGLFINEGLHTIRVRCRFTGGKDPTLKAEYRMIGSAERIHGQRRQ